MSYAWGGDWLNAILKLFVKTHTLKFVDDFQIDAGRSARERARSWMAASTLNTYFQAGVINFVGPGGSVPVRLSNEPGYRR